MADIFDAEALLQSEGLKVIGAKSPGIYQVVDQKDGTEGQLDLNAMLKAQDIDPSKVNIKINSPSSAIQVTPVSLLDRAKLAVGNKEGNINYLKSKFQQVQYDPDNGVVVNNHGLWQAIDPSYLGGGNAWDKTKEIAADILDVGADIASGAGALAGGAAGSAAGPAGSVAGAGAAAAGVRAMTTSLGRLAGTYSATPEEQLQDAGIEGLLNMGGQVFSLGAKPTLAALGKGLKGVSNFATDSVKDILSESFGLSTGAGAQAVRTALDSTDKVVGHLALAKQAAGGTVDGIRSHLLEQNISTAQELLDSAAPALQGKFVKAKAALVGKAESMPAVHLGDLASSTLSDLEAAGIVSSEQAASENAPRIFKVMSDADAVARQNAGQPASMLSEKAQNQLKPLINQLNAYTKRGQVEGKDAASSLMDLKKSFNDVLRDYNTYETAGSAKPIVDQIASNFRNKIGTVFKDANLDKEYLATINDYDTYANAVNTAKGLASSEGKVETFVNRLLADSGKNRQAQGLRKSLEELMPDAVEKFQSIQERDAARKLSSWLPKMGLAANVGSATTAAVTMALGPAAGAAIAASQSPKAVLTTIRAAKGGLGVLQSLNPTQRASFLKDPALVQGFLQTIGSAGTEAAATASGLVNQATAPQLDPQTQEYLNFAKQNPNDPRSAAILKKLGM